MIPRTVLPEIITPFMSRLTSVPSGGAPTSPHVPVERTVGQHARSFGHSIRAFEEFL